MKKAQIILLFFTITSCYVIDVTSTIDHADCSLNALGSIDLTVDIDPGYSVRSFSWRNGTTQIATSEDLISVPPNEFDPTDNYTADIQYAYGSGNSATVAIHHKVLRKISWIAVSSEAAFYPSQERLEKIGIYNYWDAGAASENYLEAHKNGFVEFQIDEGSASDVQIAFGLTCGYPTNHLNSGTSTGHSTIDFLFRTELDASSQNRTFYIENNFPLRLWSPSTFTLYGSYLQSDKFKIERYNDTIKFYRNNVLVDTIVQNGISDSAMFADVSIFSDTAAIINARATFGCRPPSFGEFNNKVFGTLKKRVDAGYYVPINDTIYFKFDEEYNDSDNTLTYSLFSDQYGSALSATATNLLTNVSDESFYGDNRYLIDVNGLSGSYNGFYFLEVKNEKGEKWYLKFKK